MAIESSACKASAGDMPPNERVFGLRNREPKQGSHEYGGREVSRVVMSLSGLLL